MSDLARTPSPSLSTASATVVLIPTESGPEWWAEPPSQRASGSELG